MYPESMDVSRRRFLAVGGVALAAAYFTPCRLLAQTDDLVESAIKQSASAKIAVQRLRRDVSALLGPGGNIAVLTGPDGKLLVDAEIISTQRQVSAALAGISSDPIKQLINTHWHWDHTGGNEWIHNAGATILAHENTRKHLATNTRVEGWKHTFRAAPSGAIPTTVFQDDYTLHVNGSTLALNHYAPAHTDSDISVHFTEADIFHTGDTFWNGAYPFIDYSTGGSIEGQIRAANDNLAKVGPKTLVIPGHGRVCGKPELELFRNVLVEMRDKIATLKKQGQSLPEIVATTPGARYDAGWGQSFMTPAAFVALVYQGV